MGALATDNAGWLVEADRSGRGDSLGWCDSVRGDRINTVHERRPRPMVAALQTSFDVSGITSRARPAVGRQFNAVRHTAAAHAHHSLVPGSSSKCVATKRPSRT